MEVVIIDDDLIYRMIVTKMIKRIDTSLTVQQCDNGKIGLSMLETLDYSNQEVVVLLDINMPVLDGWGFLDQFEKSDFYNLDKLIIYVVSSSTDESDILKATNYGFVKSFLHKPLSEEDLKAIIHSN